MWRNVHRIVARTTAPLVRLVDDTSFLIGSPQRAARRLIADNQHSIRHAVAYFIGAFSAGVVLTKLSFTALQIEDIRELPYWAVHVGIVVSIALCAAALVVPFRSLRTEALLSSVLFAYGCSFLLGGFVLAGASLTLAILREIGYLPEFKKDLAASFSRPSFEAIGMRAYYSCLRQESALYDALYNALGGAHEALRAPIDWLSYLQPIIHVAASFLFAALAYLSTVRLRWTAAVIALLSSGLIFAGTLLGIVSLAERLHASTPCGAQSISTAQRGTAEGQVQQLAEMFMRDIGMPGPIMTLTAVEP